ncbi:MAG TPA: VWA domain-containing protein [Fimbriimonadaceae bacterium]|nr:VWA domain-containing protein [Fimbriimonadaceae bacterium]
MNTQETRLDGVAVCATAHEDPSQRLLMVTVSADDAPPETKPSSSQVALVIDRSGSMAGEKLEITKAAVAKLVRSLQSDDRVAIVAYDDQVDLITGLTSPSEPVARLVERIHPGGSTNLYGGWLMGAKVVGAGGRVILLSDGQANAGRYSDALSLTRQAEISYRDYKVTTSTIGVGRDYDEGLMAGMAYAGAGGHYFAKDADAIMEAFSQERFALRSLALSHVTIKIGQDIHHLGHVWAGETKQIVLKVTALTEPATIRFTRAGSSMYETVAIDLPTEFGFSDNVTLEALLAEIAESDRQASAVQDPTSARLAKEELRSLILRLMSHPLADSDVARVVREQAMQAIERLEQLERHYDEREASMLRKTRMQSAHNLTERAKAYTSEAGEFDAVRTFARQASAPTQSTRLDPVLFGMAPPEQWRRWRAYPVAREGRRLIVAMERARDGFLIDEMESALGLKIRAIQALTVELDAVLS